MTGASMPFRILEAGETPSTIRICPRDEAQWQHSFPTTYALNVEKKAQLRQAGSKTLQHRKKGLLSLSGH